MKAQTAKMNLKVTLHPVFHRATVPHIQAPLTFQLLVIHTTATLHMLVLSKKSLKSEDRICWYNKCG